MTFGTNPTLYINSSFKLGPSFPNKIDGFDYKLVNSKVNGDVETSTINFDNKSGEAFLYRGALKIALNQERSACNDFNRAKALGASEAADALSKYCK